MSFNGSQQLVMKHLLLRRNVSGGGENDAAETLLDQQQHQQQHQYQRQQELSVLSRIIPAPGSSHKRKQSDTIALGDLEITKADLNATFHHLEKIEQGADDDEQEDEETLMDVIMAPCDGSKSWGCKLGEVLSPYQVTNLVQLVAVFLLFIAVASVRSSRRIYRADSGDDQIQVEDENMEIIGDPFEADVPSYNWIEFYDDPRRMGTIVSAGPRPYDASKGGLHVFENVCLTNNIDAPKPPVLDTSMRGLIYFSKDKKMGKNNKRCVPCSTADVGNVWGECGMKGLHAMYATSVEDWNECMSDRESHQTMIRRKQNQSPSFAQNVHFFEEPTFLLQFQAHDKERSLFDTLLTYLPHWHNFKERDNFPFQSVISHSVEGCLTHSRNWFCELTHQMGAFGRAREVMWEPKDTTLYCFKDLYVNQLAYQRNLDHGELITKDLMDDFRDEIFHNFALPRPRDMVPVWKENESNGVTKAMNIAFYGNDSKGRKEWVGLDILVSSTQSIRKYHGVKFNLIESINSQSVAEQARIFNEADAVVMATGDHFANAIFSTDDTIFVEVGCRPQSLINNSNFMALISGTHQSVNRCPVDAEAGELCVSCESDQSDTSFSMSDGAFHALLDDLLMRYEKKISFLRDSL